MEYLNNDEEGGVILSIDFNKAFDRVEHDFLFDAMRKFGFGDRLINWLATTRFHMVVAV